MRGRDARRLLGPAPIIGLSIKTVAQARAAPLELLDYVGIGGVFATTSKDNPNRPIGLDGLARIARVFRARTAICRSAPSPASTRRNAAQVIAAGADGVAVISALSLAPDPAAAARELRAIVDDGARAAGRAHDRDRRHHRGLGFRRRRRHPGRPQDLLGARRLWRLGDHGADRAEHQGRHRHPRRAGGFRHRADRCGVLRSRGRRREDRHAVAAGSDRGGGRRARALAADTMSCSIR